MTATTRATGAAQYEAWKRREMPSVEEVRPGLWSIPLPMTTSPLRYVIVYALALPDGIALIDAGWSSDEAWDALTSGIRSTGHDISEVRFIAITHLHPDHFGMAPRIRELSGAAIAMHSVDAGLLVHRDPAEQAEWLRSSVDQLHRLGAPDAVVDAPPVSVIRFPEGAPVDIVLADGDLLNLPGWDLRAVWTPGHTAGHLCFAEHSRGIAFTGDHVLPRISPNISTNPGQTPNPLRDYLHSLRATAEMPVGEALPAHEYRFRGLGDRARELIDHHEARLAEIAEAVAEVPESTAWEINTRISWSRPFEDMSDKLRRLALRETHSHLLVLADRGSIVATDETPQRWFPSAQHAVSAALS